MLDIINVTRAFDGQAVLRGINLPVDQGEIVCLLGPSGCGKTTMLRIVAGLEHADGGDVRINGNSIMATPVHQRDFGLMFQDFALFPHMNVAENVGFGLRMRPVADDQQRVDEVIRLVGLAGFEQRDVGELSGGERQRVALARSLAPRPRLLMLDEPLGSLDAALRTRLVVELRQIIKQIGLTAIYVTHDQEEAFAIADRIAIMNAGQIEQVTIPEDIYRRPRTTFVARFLGLNNIVPVERSQNGVAHTPVGTFEVPEKSEALLVHPLGIHVVDSGRGMLDGEIEERVFQGDSYRMRMRHESGVRFTFHIPSFAALVPAEGETIAIKIDREMILPLRESPA